MEQEYYVKDKVINMKAKYVPMKVKLYKSGTEKFMRHAKSGKSDEILSLDRRMPDELFIVTLRHENHVDGASKGFVLKTDAYKYIRNIGRAIQMKYGPTVDLHYGLGQENIDKLLIELDVDKHVSFSARDDKNILHKYSIGLSLYKNKVKKYKRDLPIRKLRNSEIDQMNHSLLEEL